VLRGLTFGLALAVRPAGGQRSPALKGGSSPGWCPEGLGLTSASAIDPTALAAQVEASGSVQFSGPATVRWGRDELSEQVSEFQHSLGGISEQVTLAFSGPADRRLILRSGSGT
jgi:hypothetical protein